MPWLYSQYNILIYVLGDKNTDAKGKNGTINENRRIIYDAVPVNIINDVSKIESGVHNGLESTLR